jgi:hypothetical protein
VSGLTASPNPAHLRSKPDPDDPIDVIALETARSLAGKPGASPDPAAMRRLGDAIFNDPTYSVDMLLHPWTRDDGSLRQISLGAVARFGRRAVIPARARKVRSPRPKPKFRLRNAFSSQTLTRASA